MNIISLALKSLLLSLVMSFAAFAAGPVNINSADATTLAAGLNGIGPSKAQAIVAYREANGPFQSADQLASVKGIGLATVEKNRDRIELGATGANKSK
ncbi:MAG TPA: ComEA family DNA-binding protein [Chiayiivirga sp.]|nr:ComEA family DNA-binding protein [Chiayiivirga sp.]